MFRILSIFLGLSSAPSVEGPLPGDYTVSAMRPEEGTCGSLTANGAVFPSSLVLSQAENGDLGFALPVVDGIEPFSCATGPSGPSCDGFGANIEVAPGYRILVWATPAVEFLSGDAFRVHEREQIDCRGAACAEMAALHGVTFPCEVRVDVDFARQAAVAAR